MAVDLSKVDEANRQVQGSTVSKVQKTYDQAVRDVLHAAFDTPVAPDALWLAGSFVNTRVSASPAISGSSAAWINLIAGSSPAGVWPNGQQYGGAGSPTIYDRAKATTTKTLTLAYATPAVPQVFTFPWNPAWVPGPTGDRQLAIVDYTSGAGIEFQGFEDNGPGTGHSAATFNVRTQDGASLPNNRVGDLPLLTGIIRPQDFAAAEIRHGLRCALQVCSNKAVWPALVSDGNTSGGIPCGSHIWLPRTASLVGLDKWQTMIAVAFQEYGAWVGDSGGGFSIALQSTADGVTTYPATINPLPNTMIRQMVVLA